MIVPFRPSYEWLRVSLLDEGSEAVAEVWRQIEDKYGMGVGAPKIGDRREGIECLPKRIHATDKGLRPSRSRRRSGPALQRQEDGVRDLEVIGSARGGASDAAKPHLVNARSQPSGQTSCGLLRTRLEDLVAIMAGHVEGEPCVRGISSSLPSSPPLP